MRSSRNSQEQLTGHIRISARLAEDVGARVKNLAQLQERLGAAQAQGVTPFFQTLLVSALALDASDIHLEPEESGTKIRLRIDGMLHDVLRAAPAVYEPVLSRIKLSARLKLNVADKPQDGRFSFSLGQAAPMEVRVASLPAEYGEALVLRLLNPKNLIAIEQLGFRPPLLKLVQKELRKPNGMILATGPTGSGKTTTLYAFLKEIERPEIKIVTIEDPIEYHLEGISQTQIHPERGYDFASGLAAIVRQDPDAILVGEIRDANTAQIALQAALTGHLVFSTLHTNDAPGTVSRLLSLGATPMNIGAALNLIIGQRLVRKVCGQCAVFQRASAAELRHIRKALKEAQGSLKLARAQGCQQCNQTGYKGRTGIFEVLAVNSAVEDFLLGQPSTAALAKFARSQGMATMYEDGLLKVVQGITTLEELQRVIGEEETT